MTTVTRPEFIEALCKPGAINNASDRAELIETHISWVLLSGEYAFKIKKPLDLGFLDFSTLDKRRAACEEELRLNRRLAPSIYEEIVSITGTADAPHINGEGEPFEFAVRMRRFPQSRLLDRLQREGNLSAEIIDTATVEIACFHQQLVPAAAETQYGTPECVWAPASQNFTQIEATPLAQQQRKRLDRLLSWSRREHTTKRGHFLRRKREGHVRECHGDLHLGNMVALDGQVILFDCIEFNADLRWIDTLSEIAFLVMDLDDRGEPHLARRCLNRYLEETGDYSGLAVLPFYLVYRALVRAKVNAIRCGQPGIEDADRKVAEAAGADYLALAERYTHTRSPRLFLTHGLSGSGKTSLTQALLESQGMVRIRSDVERKRLAGLDTKARSDSPLSGGLYAKDMTTRTYSALLEIAEGLLRDGVTVIVDATFLRQAQRIPFFALAESLRIPITVLHFDAPIDVLMDRVSARLKRGKDASEATLEVLQHQRQQLEALTPAERSNSVVFDTRDPDCMISWIERAFAGN